MTNTATTPNKAPVRSDYERDDYESQVLEATLDRLIEERKKRRPPTQSEQDEMSGSAILQGLQELEEEELEERQRHAKLVRLLRGGRIDVS